MGGKDKDWDFGGWAAGWSTVCGPGLAFGRRRHGRSGRAHSRRAHRRRRVFERGDLKYVILRLLTEKPMHGYEVMQALERESEGLYSASPGSVYPALQLLQDQGYVTSEEQDGRRVYSITDSGREHLDRHSDRVDDVFERVAEAADDFMGSDMRAVASSFMRFAQASWEEAARRAGDSEKLKDLREAIDRAAKDLRARAERAATSE